MIHGDLRKLFIKIFEVIDLKMMHTHSTTYKFSNCPILKHKRPS